MALEKQEALQMVYTCLGEINTGRPANAQVNLLPETRLLGSGAELDSLEVVNLIVGLEALLAERLLRPLVLVDERTFGGDVHPFRDAETLASYLVSKSSEAG